MKKDGNGILQNSLFSERYVLIREQIRRRNGRD